MQRGLLPLLLLLCAPGAAALLARRGASESVGVDGANNLCKDGHIAPELILFGPARASTSTFARNLIKSPGVVYGNCIESDNLPYACPSIGIKEMHFFSSHFSATKNHYLAHYPSCQTKTRIVAADLSPGYHANLDAAKRIADFYGDKKDRVRFVMLLRNPMKCMQSFFYYEGQDKKGTFGDHVKNVLKTNSSRYMNNALYAPALERFFSIFKPSQLTIVPMQYNEMEKNGEPRITDFLFDQFGVPHPDEGDAAIDRWNFNDAHPAVETDLDDALSAQLQQRLDALTGAKLLGNIIARVMEQQGGGPHLYGYKGAPSDGAAIAAWLADGW